jgi:hypothetical protein
MKKLFLLLLFSTCFAIDVPIKPCAINRPPPAKGEIALCAMFKNEASFLKEWIEYHRMIGVDYFYLYNNGSQDHFWEVLMPYVKAGIVELYDVHFDSSKFKDGAKTHNQVQVILYSDAIKRAKHRFTWLAIIDSDEFISLVKETSLKEVMKEYSYATGLVLYWQIYGTSGIWDLKGDELLIEKLLYREPKQKTALFKMIVRPEYAICNDPHWCKMSPPGFSVSPDHCRFSHTRVFSELPVDRIRINHYTYRTESFYWHVKRQRRRDWGDCPSPEEEKKRLERANSVYDPVMLKFVSELKTRL